MKRNFYAGMVRLIAANLGNAALAAILILASSIAVFGQVSSYSDVGESGGSAVGYGAVSGVYGSGWHVNSTNVNLNGPSGSASASGGNSATAYLSVTQDGYYSLSTTHEGYCPYSQSNHTIGGSGGGQNICADTCTACRASREGKEIACAALSAVCELAAINKYNGDIQTCDNTNYCKPNHPDYDQQQCNQCKDTAQEILIGATAACAAGYIGCRALISPDCEVPTIKKADCSACSNSPF
jgi:hypothetical protein